MEVTTLRATITTMETTNTKKEIELQTIMETNKDMNAKMIDITSSTNENSKRLEVAHVAEQKQIRSRGCSKQFRVDSCIRCR